MFLDQEYVKLSYPRQYFLSIPFAFRCTKKILTHNVDRNLAETGVTIPDITCVIDTGKHREMR